MALEADKLRIMNMKITEGVSDTARELRERIKELEVENERLNNLYSDIEMRALMAKDSMGGERRPLLERLQANHEELTQARGTAQRRVKELESKLSAAEDMYISSLDYHGKTLQQLTVAQERIKELEAEREQWSKHNATYNAETGVIEAFTPHGFYSANTNTPWNLVREAQEELSALRQRIDDAPVVAEVIHDGGSVIWHTDCDKGTKLISKEDLQK